MERLRDAVRTANAAPDADPADLLDRRLRDRLRRGTMTIETSPAPTADRVITYAEAVREAIGQAMEADDRVFLLGEDIGVYGGAFGVSGGLSTEFGPERVRDTPISELGIVGAAVGAALAGHAARRGDPVHRLHHPGDGPDRQPGRQDPLHVRRQDDASRW